MSKPVEIQEYVCGFMFDESLKHVALVKKNRPKWQEGLLNGIGGHVEKSDESFHFAMAREFREETGVYTEPLQWKAFAEVTGDGWRVNFFSMISDKMFDIKSMTDEETLVESISIIMGSGRVIPNLNWLIPMAVLDGKHKYCKAEAE